MRDETLHIGAARRAGLCALAAAAALLLACLPVCVPSAWATTTRAAAPALELDGTVKTAMKSLPADNGKSTTSAGWGKSYVCKFTPEKDGLYEFRFKSGLYAHGDYCAYQSVLTDEDDMPVAYMVDGGDATDFNVDLVGDLKAGKTYWLQIHRDLEEIPPAEVPDWKSDVTVVEHAHDMYTDQEGKQHCRTFSCRPNYHYGVDDYYYHGLQLAKADVRSYRNWSAEGRDAMVYTGKQLRPAVKLVGERGETVDPSQYTVFFYGKNVNIGYAQVRARLAKSGAVAKGSFWIVPKATAAKSATRSGAKVKVTWKKQPRQITGYRIEFSKDKSFKNPLKEVHVVGASKTSRTVSFGSAAKAKKCKYVRVCTYKRVQAKGRWYSARSKVLTVKV